MKNILNEISKERDAQDEKWGIQTHHPEKWMVILMEEVGEAAAECREAYPFISKIPKNTKNVLLNKYRKEMIQVAAVAVAAVESLDRMRS